MSLPEVLSVVRSMAKFHAAGRAFLARNKTQVPILKQRNYHERFSCHLIGNKTTFDVLVPKPTAWGKISLGINSTK